MSDAGCQSPGRVPHGAVMTGLIQAMFQMEEQKSLILIYSYELLPPHSSVFAVFIDLISSAH